MNKEDLICEGLRILEIIDFERTKQEYYSWKAKVKTAVSTSSLSDAVQKNIFVNLHFVENEYSIEDSKKSLRSSIENVIQLLDSSDITAVSDFEEYTACQIIEKVLSNFYMYIKAMYKDPIHKKSSFSKDMLNAFSIENEYDVQRLLYSWLLPVFPETRVEVSQDNGYSEMKPDIYLEKYNLAIEVKCTRPSMTERQLTEELGADCFHYKTRTLYIFIYDKVGMIKNPAAYKAAFKRDLNESEKKIRIFIIQPNLC